MAVEVILSPLPVEHAALCGKDQQGKPYSLCMIKIFNYQFLLSSLVLVRFARRWEVRLMVVFVSGGMLVEGRVGFFLKHVGALKVSHPLAT